MRGSDLKVTQEVECSVISQMVMVQDVGGQDERAELVKLWRASEARTSSCFP